MKGVKISIIIPVYNSEKYLKECLDSCINQTMAEIEIICVDDGSTDNSINILRQYERVYSRIKIICHEENEKQGAARNTGVEDAKGEYVWFVDSDDFINQSACQLLYDTIKKHNVDLLSFCGVVFTEVGDVRKFANASFFQGLQFNRPYFPSKKWKEMNFYNLAASPCIYLAKREVVQKIKFREGVYCEDTDFSLKLFSLINSMICIPYTAYYRRWGTGSVTQGSINKKLLEDSISVIGSLHDFVEKNKISKRHFLYKFLIEYVGNVKIQYEKNSEINPDNLEDLQRFDKKYRPWEITVMFRKAKGFIKNRFNK